MIALLIDWLIDWESLTVKWESSKVELHKSFSQALFRIMKSKCVTENSRRRRAVCSVVGWQRRRGIDVTNK